ncbi:hypothetical protein DITRI_Ditri05aG0163300 [Diplodiscus trichospermus]
MALYLRRAIGLRITTTLIRRSSTTQTCSISHFLLFHKQETCHTQNPTPLPSFDFLRDSRRGFAKSKKSKDDSGGSTIELAADIGPSVKATATSQMDAAVVALSRELAKLRTGRASAGMLDHIIVETDGVKMQLNHLAVVSVIDSKTLSVNPYDPNTLKALETAIVSSPLGLNPKVDGQRLIAAIPPLCARWLPSPLKMLNKA